jgi:glycosyltransferase involved in cell wall biosynthesis
VRVLIATTQVPFVRGGAEILANSLRKALIASNHKAEIVAIPFKWYPPERILDHMLASRLLDITESSGTTVDLVIGLKFPAYLIPHPNKVLWILHQHRAAYERWDSPIGDLIHHPNGFQVRRAIHEADCRLIPEAKKIFTISQNVSQRLRKYSGIDSIPLYHPPQHAEMYHSSQAEDYFFFPSRLACDKRQSLVLQALAQTHCPVAVYFAGSADYPGYAEELKLLVRQLKLQDRIKWLGQINEEEKRRLYARSLAVIFPPEDEDYGYVTLEAMLSCRAVITCSDSGGPLEFVVDGQTGMIVEPTPTALGGALDVLWEDRARARILGEAGRNHYDSLGIAWSNVLTELLS